MPCTAAPPPSKISGQRCANTLPHDHLKHQAMSQILKSQHECAYCGWTGDTRDHVPALSTFWLGSRQMSKKSGQNWKKTVPCCRECNSLLGAFPSSNLRERADHLIEQYEKRYKKLLSQPVWGEEELETLGPSIKKYVLAKSVERQRIIDRMAHLGWVSRFGVETLHEYKNCFA